MADTKLRNQQLQLDTSPTTGSGNPVTSGGVKTYVDGKADKVVTSDDTANNGLSAESNYGDATAALSLLAGGYEGGRASLFATNINAKLEMTVHPGTDTSPGELSFERTGSSNTTTIISGIGTPTAGDQAANKEYVDSQSSTLGNNKVDKVVTGDDPYNRFSIQHQDNYEAYVAVYTETNDSVVMLSASNSGGETTELVVTSPTDTEPGFITVSTGGDNAVIQGVATPIEDNQAANKEYVDGRVATLGDDKVDKFVISTGTGATNSFAVGIDDSGVVRKASVAAIVNGDDDGSVAISAVYGGNINMMLIGSDYILFRNVVNNVPRAISVLGVATPTDAFGAANKTYVDTAIAAIQLPEHYKGQLEYVCYDAATKATIEGMVDGNKVLTLEDGVVAQYDDSVPEWTVVETLTPQAGDYYYVLNLTNLANTSEGSITFNGTTWDIAPDHYHQPNNTNIGLDTNGQLEVISGSIGSTQLNTTTNTVLTSVAGKVSKTVTGAAAVNMFQAENYTDGNIVQVIADASSPGTGRILLQASHGSNYVAVTVLPETDEDPGCIYLSSYGGTINPNNVLGIKGVANPIDPTDAANKAYVDSQVAANAFHIANHDLTPQLDGSKTVFNIDASIKATSVIIATYAGQVLVPGVNYSIDATAHTLTYLGTPPDSNENRYLILLVIDIGS